jgi:hypothetical protein
MPVMREPWGVEHVLNNASSDPIVSFDDQAFHVLVRTTSKCVLCPVVESTQRSGVPQLLGVCAAALYRVVQFVPLS